LVDPHTTIRTFLAADATLTALTSTRIYAGRDVPPKGYKPSDGACVVFRVRGGAPDYDDALLNPSVQFKVYGEDEVAAFAVYQALYDRLHNGYSATILHAESEVLGQLLEEPDTEWRFVLAYFLVQIKQS